MNLIYLKKLSKALTNDSSKDSYLQAISLLLKQLIWSMYFGERQVILSGITLLDSREGLGYHIQFVIHL